MRTRCGDLLGQMLALGEKDINADVAGFVIPLSRVPQRGLLSACSSRSLQAAFAPKVTDWKRMEFHLPIFDDCLEMRSSTCFCGRRSDLMQKDRGWL